MQYVFILGHNPELSVAEIKAVLPQAMFIEQTSSFLILENPKISCGQLLDQLGGTIKRVTINQERDIEYEAASKKIKDALDTMEKYVGKDIEDLKQ